MQLRSPLSRIFSFLEKYRDILKIYDGHLLVLILGIENQSDLHLLMPLRQLLYDALRYESQRSEIARRHKKAKDLTGLEYLSGFSDHTRLTPYSEHCRLLGNRALDGSIIPPRTP